MVGGAGGIGQPLSMLMAMDPNAPSSKSSSVPWIPSCSAFESNLRNFCEQLRFRSSACMLQPQKNIKKRRWRPVDECSGEDLTMAMVPAEGVAADLSHLNMKCKVSWHILAYLGISWHILAYLGISWHILAYLGMQLTTRMF